MKTAVANARPASRAVLPGLIASLPLLMAAVPAAAASPVSPTEAVDREIRALEQDQARAAAARDRQRLEALFAQDFRVVNPSGGVGTRQELLDILASQGPAPYASAAYVTETVKSYGDTVVSLGMDIVVPNQGPQAGQTVRRRVSQVWRRDGSTWRLVLRHATIIVP
jgi:hypothetical protein